MARREQSGCPRHGRSWARADQIYSHRVLRFVTHFGPQRKAALRFIFTKSLFARLQTQPFFFETEIVR
jgi:hypothetical protein